MVPSPLCRVDPSPQPYYIRLHLAPTNGIPAGHTVVRSVRLRVQLSLPFARLASADLSQTHLSTSAPLSRLDHHRPVSGQLYETPSGGTGHVISLSCCLSASGIRFLDILFPPGTFSFPYGRPTDHNRSDPVGVSMFRTSKTRPGRAFSSLRGGGVLPAARTSTTGTRRFPTASPAPR